MKAEDYITATPNPSSFQDRMLAFTATPASSKMIVGKKAKQFPSHAANC
jgi:hypothetical protein